jgi:hypothetical protein
LIERREQRFLYFTVGYYAGGVNENVQSAEDSVAPLVGSFSFNDEPAEVRR